MAISLSSRYAGLATVVIGGQPSLALRPAPPAQPMPDSLLHVVAAGETLGSLAYAYYGREDLWWRIADANPGRYALDWSPGDTLVIPPLRIATLTAGP
ncbi:MAG TPA: LysM domain-containing protein [Caulobacteraceae bacterium]|nr:LysM domain-containing protein [Caulobacteraceae bacterium]